MAFPKGKGGRNKGSLNKRTLKVEEMAAACSVDPFQILLWVAEANWKALGFDAPSKISYSPAGIEFEEMNIKLPDRIQAAKEATKYLYCQKKAVELSTAEEGIRIEIVDYTSHMKKLNGL